MAWVYWEWQGTAYFRQQEALDARRAYVKRMKYSKRKARKKVSYPQLSFAPRGPGR